MNTIIIETKSNTMAKALINFLKFFDDKIVIKKKFRDNKLSKEMPLSEPDDAANPESLFGIWKNRNLTLERLRIIAWGGRA